MWTPQEEDRLQQINALLGSTPPAPAAPPDETIMQRIGKQAANLPSGIAESMMQGYQGLYNSITPQGGEIDLTNVPKPYDIAAPKTIGQSAVDIGAGLARLLPAAIVPEAAAGEGLSALGLGAQASRIGGSAIGWGLTGTPQGTREGAIQAGIGGLTAATAGAPLTARIPLALGAGALGYIDGSQQSPTMGAVMGGLNVALPFAEPAIEAALGRARQINVAGAAQDGAKIAPTTTPTSQASAPGMDLTGGINQTGRQAYGDAPNLYDAFRGKTVPEPQGPLPFTPSAETAPGEAPLALGQGPVPQQTNGGLPFFNAPDTSHLVVGMRAPEVSGWQQGPRMLAGSLDEQFPGAVQSPEQAYGGAPNVYDAFAGRTERNGTGELATLQNEAPAPLAPAPAAEPLPPAPEPAPSPAPATADIAAAEHPLASLSTKAQKLLDDNNIAKPGELPSDITGDAFRLSKMLKTKADLNQVKNALKKINEIRMQSDVMGGVDSDLTRELNAKAQLLTETIEHAEGLPGKLDTFIRFDPDYEVKFPSKDNKAYMARGGFEVPKKGEAAALWGDDGMPQSATVTSATDKVVNYEVFDPMTGESRHSSASPEEFATLQKHPSERTRPSEPVEPAPVATSQSTPFQSPAPRQVKFRDESGNVRTGNVVNTEDGVHQIEYEDPIRGGTFTKYVGEGDVTAAGDASGPREIPNGGVPFKDVEGAKTIKSKAEGDFDGLDDLINRDSPDHFIVGEDGEKIPMAEIPTLEDDQNDIVAYLQRYKSQTIGQATRELDGLGGIVLKDMMKRVLAASGQKEFPVNFTHTEDGWSRLGRFSPISGKVELSWEHTRAVLRDWPNMSPAKRASAIISITKLLGHEVSHAAISFGSKAGLEINGRNLVDAIENEVFKLPLTARQFMAGEIKESIGELGIVSNYLAGDTDTVYNHYLRNNPGLTKPEARKMAAEEFMVELMSAELHGRIQTKGLTGVMRAAVDKLKNVVKGVMRFFGRNESNVAALQNLRDIANTALNKFGEATSEDFAKTWTSSRFWENKASKGLRELEDAKNASAFTEPTDPMDWIVMDYAAGTPPHPATSDDFLRSEMVRAGIRGVGGALAGGLVAPTVSNNQISAAEGMLLGGVMGLFGPALARRIVNSDLAVDMIKAAKEGGGSPTKTLAALMDGKSLRELGGEALHTERNGVARFVRNMEIALGVNFDPKLRGVLENSRGLVAEQMGMVFDAMRKAKDFPVSQGLKDATLQFLQGDLDGASYVRLLGTADEKAYGTLITTARAGTDNLQTMLASGLKEGQFKAQVLDSVGSYVGKFYKAHTTGEFNDAAFSKAKADLKTAFPKYSDEVADSIMYQYMREVKGEQSMFGRVSKNGQKIDSALWQRRLSTESEIEAQQNIVSGLAKDHPEYDAAKSKLDYMESHKITDGWAEWLNEVKDPKERILRTFQKLYASSMSSKTFDLLSQSVDQHGLKFSYGAEELSRIQEGIKNKLAGLKPGDPQFATLQKQLAELKYYVPLPAGNQFGKLSGKMVSRFVRDEISTETSPFKWMDQPVFRAISSFNNVIKIGRTALNPITVIRNYMQMPMFGLIAKSNMTDMTQAWRSIAARDSMHNLMLRQGITNADFSASELAEGPGKIFSGFFDSDAATRMVAKGFDKAMEIYRAPDMVLRAGVFITAMKRFGGADLAAAMRNPDVIERATQYTNRYTMNYHAVPNIIKVGRQIPAVSLFLSYTSEITRILKNLTQDAINPAMDSAGRTHALLMLGGMAAIPALLTATAESSLSAADKKDWDRVKDLSPDYARARFRIPLGRNASGGFRYADFTNLLPADSYSMMVKAIANGDWKAAAAVNPVLNLENTPLLNIATEQIAGKDLQTGRSLEGLDRVREVMKEILPPSLPGVGYEAQRVQNAFTPNANGGLGLTNSVNGKSIMPSDIIMNYLTGVKVGDISLDVVQRGFVQDAQQKIAEQQSLLRQTTAQNVTSAQRQVAIDKFNSAVNQVILQLHERLGQ